MVGDNQELNVVINLSLEVDSLDNILIFFDGKQKQQISSSGVTTEVELISTNNSLNFVGGYLVELAITFVLGVSSGVVGNLLYSKLIAGAKKLEISNKRTRISEEKVVEAIETIQQYVKENQERNQHKESQ